MFFCLCSYSYHVHRKTKSKVTWRCTVRNKEATICSAMVNQEGTSFTRMGQDHTHEAVTGKATRVKAGSTTDVCCDKASAQPEDHRTFISFMGPTAK